MAAENMMDSADADIPLAEPEIGGNEWQYIKECLDTGWVSTAGDYVKLFEEKVAAYIGCKHAVATTSGTAALHVALLAAGVKPEDEVIMSALTFVAPANAIRYVGAWPVFIDADPCYWQLDTEKLGEFLQEECHMAGGVLRNKVSGRRIAAVLPVHVLGHPADMDTIMRLAHQYGLPVVADAAESLGAEYKDKQVGRLGDIACFSFNGNKVITTGGGGMVVTENEQWAKRVEYLTTQAKDDPVEYVHNEIGYNYRLTNIQAALGVAQMERLNFFLDAKRAIATRYKTGLSNISGVRWADSAEWATPTFWLSTLLIDSNVYGIDSRELMARLQKAKIQSRPLWCPMSSLLPFRDCMAFKVEVANLVYRDGLSLPSSVGLKPEDQDRVIRTIREISTECR
jgi:perosamine synthetase